MSSAKPYEILPKLFQGLAGAALAVLVLWALALFTGRFERNRVLPGTEKARAEARYKVREEIDKAAAALHETKWIDKEKGSVHLSIERAMEVAATELAAKEARASSVTVAWVAPQMPDYSKLKEEASAPAANASPAAAPAAVIPAPVPAPIAPVAPPVPVVPVPAPAPAPAPAH